MRHVETTSHKPEAYLLACRDYVVRLLCLEVNIGHTNPE
jgi:hypothetical protein